MKDKNSLKKKFRTRILLGAAIILVGWWIVDGNGRSAPDTSLSSSARTSGIESGTSGYTTRGGAEEDDSVEMIATDIQQNGPAELRQLNPLMIRQAVEAFVYGERSGALSHDQIARMGGVEQAAERSLSAQLRAAGGNLQ
ncbi:hypothetical protein [Burkholderia vietnamiensis]|uniref:hypothetical protein n=1 Tax=Burkholderia vietnamiensis TaxID=60552 RepID=UPI00352EB2D4